MTLDNIPGKKVFAQRDVRETPATTATATAVGLTDESYLLAGAGGADLTAERTLIAGEGIDFNDAGAGGNFEVLGEDASDTNKGIASFNATDFTLTAGNVVLADSANLVSLTDNSMVDTLHRHSELSASDGTPDQALTLDAAGIVSIQQNQLRFSEARGLVYDATLNDLGIVLDGTMLIANSLVYFDDAGLVGIGTSSPSTLLEIAGAYVASKGQLYIDGTTHAYLSLDAAANSDAGILLIEGGVTKWDIYNDGNDADKFKIGTAITVEQGGNVGLGISPLTKLTVEGALTLKEQAEASATTAAYGQIWVDTAVPNVLMFTDDADTDQIVITSTKTNYVTLTDGSDASALHVHTVVSLDTTATGANLTTMTDNSMADTLHRHSELSASDGTPDRNLVLNAAGRVGIGGASHNALLEVKSVGAGEGGIALESYDSTTQVVNIYQDGVNAAGVIELKDTSGNLDIKFKETIHLLERAAAIGDSATYGQIWVKNANPNELWFTDGDGGDHQVAYV